MATCKYCKIKYVKMRTVQQVCSFDCAVKLDAMQKKKQVVKVLKEKQKGRTFYLQKAQTIFNKWIRNRDAKQPCISCDKKLKEGNIDAGHYYSQGVHSNVRFNENNVHAQCSRPCNKDKSGDLINYRHGLMLRIGMDGLQELEQQSKIQKYWSVEELMEIIKTYS